MRVMATLMEQIAMTFVGYELMASAWPEPPSARFAGVLDGVEALALGITETRTEDKLDAPERAVRWKNRIALGHRYGGACDTNKCHEEERLVPRCHAASGDRRSSGKSSLKGRSEAGGPYRFPHDVRPTYRRRRTLPCRGLSEPQSLDT